MSIWHAIFWWGRQRAMIEQEFILSFIQLSRPVLSTSMLKNKMTFHYDIYLSIYLNYSVN